MKDQELHLKIGGELSQYTARASQLAVLAATQGERHKIDAIYVAACGAIGSLHILAQLLGHHGKNSPPQKDELGLLVNPTSTLLAALLAQHMSPESGTYVGERDGNSAYEQQVMFGPEVMWTAIEQVERLIGRKVDGSIDPQILSSLRKIIADSSNPMNRFLAQRRETPGNLH